MKSLELEFVANYDKCGDHTFKQLMRQGNVALYDRQSMEGRSLWHEVFVFKTIKAGTPLPGGNTVPEDYEQYPGKSAFGKTAWAIAGGDYAKRSLAKFNELVKKAADLLKESEDEADADASPSVPVVKVEKQTSSINFPAGKFTHSELAEFNGKTRSQVYFVLQDMIKAGVIISAGTRRPESGKGKACNLFEKVA